MLTSQRCELGTISYLSSQGLDIHGLCFPTFPAILSHLEKGKNLNRKADDKAIPQTGGFRSRTR